MKAATALHFPPKNLFIFQSTPPVKAATPCQPLLGFRFAISIHAAREGGDVFAVDKLGFAVISIHAAREGGDSLRVSARGRRPQFQSTPPVKAATTAHTPTAKQGSISIHAAREGGDSCAETSQLCTARFQSTPPVKAATEEEK